MSDVIQFPPRDVRSQEAKLWDELNAATDLMLAEMPYPKDGTLDRFKSARRAFLAEFMKNGGAA